MRTENRRIEGFQPLHLPLFLGIPGGGGCRSSCCSSIGCAEGGVWRETACVTLFFQYSCPSRPNTRCHPGASVCSLKGATDVIAARARHVGRAASPR